MAARLVLAGAVLSILCGTTFLLWSSWERKRPLHVIVVPETLVRKGDGYLYDPAFPNPVHSGAEFRLLEERGGWVHAQFPNDEKGWIPGADCASVKPRK